MPCLVLPASIGVCARAPSSVAHTRLVERAPSSSAWNCSTANWGFRCLHCVVLRTAVSFLLHMAAEAL